MAVLWHGSLKRRGMIDRPGKNCYDKSVWKRSIRRGVP